ncbi:putative phosphoglycerate mutase [Colletotrichum sp. SAR 10_65]|nr:putative phosphoglycerate mutase [Colletotrichum sp. SAR 10_65]
MATTSSDNRHFVVLGAGVIGLSTAITLRSKHPSARITLLAEYFPGDYHIDYCSPWAGANWCSSASDNGLLESFDRVTFERFKEIAKQTPEAGIKSSPLRMIFDQKIDDAEILSEGTGKLWYDDLVGGAVSLNENELPKGAVFGLDLPSTFVINSQIYLQWLLEQCRQGGVSLLRRQITHIKEARISADVVAVFNCTGLGSYHLGGVEDKAMYPTRGQTVLVEQPIQPLKRMYFRSPRRVDNDTTYVFQRPLAGGIVLGGCREDGNWDKNVDPELAKRIMERCCALAPELGRPEDLKVIKHADDSPGGKATTQAGLGLLDKAFGDATQRQESGDTKPWDRFAAHVNRLNDESPDGVNYKVLYLTRHGLGYHNVQAAKVGTAEWDRYWSRLDGDGVVTWLDAELVDTGITQARDLGAFWKAATAAEGVPFPESFYTSPLRRCLETSKLVFGDLVESRGQQFGPVIKEGLRERMTDHTCDKRSSRTWIEGAYPKYIFEPGFTEEDQLWKADQFETTESHVARKQQVLDEIFSTDSSQFVSLTVHSYAIAAILRVGGQEEFRVREGSSIAVLVRGERVATST